MYMLAEPGYGVLFSPNEFYAILPVGFLILINLLHCCKEACYSIKETESVRHARQYRGRVSTFDICSVIQIQMNLDQL